MAVDQGGLRYSLEVTDKFSAATKEFQAEIEKSRQSMLRFQGDFASFSSSAASAKTSLEALNRAQKEMNALRLDSARITRVLSRSTSSLADQEQRLAVSLRSRLGLNKSLNASESLRTKTLKAQNVEIDKVVKKTRLLNQSKAQQVTSTTAANKATQQSIAKSAQFRQTIDREIERLKRLERQRRATAAQGVGPSRGATGGAGAIGPGAHFVPLQSAGGGPGGLGAIQNILLSSGLIQSRTAAAKKGLADLGEESQKTGRRLFDMSRIMTRLFTAFVFFAAARSVVNGFKAMVSSAVTFNATIETATLGVASLIASLADVRDTSGQSVGSAQELTLAYKEARRQVGLLRADGIRAAASFEELVQTFQVAVGPGLQAGLNLDQVRKLTVSISQAASALGLSQDQLAEEVRSLLSGTISARTTRIATSLGITNEDIKRFKETGTLVQELEARFSAFEIAGKDALDTFSVAVSNSLDAIQQLLATGGFEFFNEIKLLLKDVQNSIVTISDEGVIIDPEAAEVVRLIFVGLKQAVAEVRTLVTTLDFGQAASTAKLIGETFAAIAKVVVNLTRGFLRGLSVSSGFIARIVEKLKGSVPLIQKLIPNFEIDSAIQLIGEFAAIFLGVSITAKFFLGTMRLVFGLLNPITAAMKGLSLIAKGLFITMKGIATAFGVLTSPVTIVLAGVALIGYFFKQWLDDLAGVELKFGSVLKIVRSGLVNAFKVALTAVKFMWIQTINTMEGIVTGLSIAVIEAFDSVLSGVEGVAGFFSDDLQKSIKEFRFATKEYLKVQRGTVDKLNRETVAAGLDYYNTLAASTLKVAQDFNKAVKENDQATSIEEIVRRAFEKTGIKGVLKDFGIDFDVLWGAAEERSRTLVETMQELPPIIGQGTLGLDRMSGVVQELNEDIIKANEDLEDGTRIIGLSAAAAEQVKARLKANRDIRTKEKDILTQLAGLEQTRIGLLTDQKLLSSQILKLDDKGRAAVERGIDIVQRYEEGQRRTAEARQALVLAETKAVAAKKKSDVDEISRQRSIIAQETEKLKVLDQQQATLLEQAKAFGESVGAEQQAEILRIIEESRRVSGSLISNERDKNRLLEDQKELREKILSVLESEAELISRQETDRLTKETEATRVRIDSESRLFEAKLRLLDIDQRIGEAEADINDKRFTLDVAEKEFATQKKILDELIAQAQSEKIRNALIKQRDAMLDHQSAQQEELNTQLNRAIERQQALNRIAEDPVQFGLTKAVRDFAIDAIDDFRATVALMTAALEGFVDFASDAIVDALDPTRKVDLVQRFQDFVNQLVRIIVSTFLKAQIFKALMGIGAFSAGDLRTLGVAGLAEGGEVPHGAMPSAAHRRARGYARGGRIRSAVASLRPKGLDRRDTTPIWAAPGEYMQPIKAVRRYGSDLMERIRAGLADPMALRAAAGLTASRRYSPPASSGPGFFSGGAIGRAAGALASGVAGKNGGTKIVNVFSDEVVHEAMLSPAGQELILNVIRSRGGRR